MEGIRMEARAKIEGVERGWNEIDIPGAFLDSRSLNPTQRFANCRLVVLHPIHAGVESREPVVVDVDSHAASLGGEFVPSGGIAKAGKFGEAI
jgi:hypothetical protein